MTGSSEERRGAALRGRFHPPSSADRWESDVVGRASPAITLMYTATVPKLRLGRGGERPEFGMAI